MPILSTYAKKKKIEYFIKDIPKDNRILEVGCGDKWLGRYMKAHGWKGYVGLDLKPTADIVGDISDWEKLGIKKESFDVIIAFEVVEHVRCFKEFFDILKPGGVLMLTSPVPHFDWLCMLFEMAGLNQKRTSPHDCIHFSEIPFFKPLEIKTVGLMAQWGKFIKQV